MPGWARSAAAPAQQGVLHAGRRLTAEAHAIKRDGDLSAQRLVQPATRGLAHAAANGLGLLATARCA